MLAQFLLESRLNTRCVKGLHYGDKRNYPASCNKSHRFLTWCTVKFVRTTASSQLILLPAMPPPTSCWKCFSQKTPSSTLSQMENHLPVILPFLRWYASEHSTCINYALWLWYLKRNKAELKLRIELLRPNFRQTKAHWAFLSQQRSKRERQGGLGLHFDSYQHVTVHL